MSKLRLTLLIDGTLLPTKKLPSTLVMTLVVARTEETETKRDFIKSEALGMYDRGRHITLSDRESRSVITSILRTSGVTRNFLSSVVQVRKCKERTLVRKTIVGR